jgi:hypothetical protein
MAQAQALRHMAGNGGRAIALAGMVAAGDERDAAFPRVVRLRLRYFPGNMFNEFKRLGPSSADVGVFTNHQSWILPPFRFQ